MVITSRLRAWGSAITVARVAYAAAAAQPASIPSRIVSTSPGMAETLFARGISSEVVDGGSLARGVIGRRRLAWLVREGSAR
jgi:hypothetical protein